MEKRPAIYRLLSLILMTLISQASAQNEQFYSGTVGKSPARFTLVWQDQGRVTGSYFHPNGKDIVYQLEGSNPSDGFLALKELTNGKLTANITLTKATQDGKIVWAGTMHNTDGRKLPISFERNQSKTESVLVDHQGNGQILKDGDYLAIISCAGIGKEIQGSAKLSISSGKSIQGSIFLAGSNVPFVLKNSEKKVVYDDDSLVGNMVLPDGTSRIYRIRKKGCAKSGILEWRGGFVGDVVSKDKLWGGDGVTINGALHQCFGSLILVRKRNDQNAPKSLDEVLKLIRIRTLGETVWKKPDGLDKVVFGTNESVANKLKGWNSLPAVVESCSDKNGDLHINFSLDLNGSVQLINDYVKKVPEVGAVRLIVRGYSQERSLIFKKSDQVNLGFADDGSIQSIYVGQITVTHWRHCAGGKVEIIGFAYKEGMKDYFTADEIGKCMKELHVYKPDKLALNSYGGPMWQSVWFDPYYGLTVFLTDAGDGELEFEAALPVIAIPEREKPWISIFDDSSKPDVVPIQQRIKDAG